MTVEVRAAGFVAVTAAASCLAISRGMVANDLALDMCDVITGRGGLSASQGVVAVIGIACCPEQAVNGGALCGDPQPGCTCVSVASSTCEAV